SFAKGLQFSRVNRATATHTGIGGKGQNAAVAYQTAATDGGSKVRVLQFGMGDVADTLLNIGIDVIAVPITANVRTCTTLIDERFMECTELIEPWSSDVSTAEAEALVTACTAAFAESAAAAAVDGIAVMGSVPAGVDPGLPARLLATLSDSRASADSRVLVDSVSGVPDLLAGGAIGLLKVNAEELELLAAETDGEGDHDGDVNASVWLEERLAAAAARLFRCYETLPWIGVTNGALPAYLFRRGGSGAETRARIGAGTKTAAAVDAWRYLVPPLGDDFINAIGAGDAAAGVTLAKWVTGTPLPDAFRFGLAAAGAACCHSGG
ncbi:unnamed protein product, partial [Phaeothamnion confervicola]